MFSKRLTLLWLAVVGLVLLAACGQAATPQTVVETVVVERTVEKEVEVTKVVEVEKEVVETVVVEKEVEKEVMVTPTPAGPKPYEGRSINFLTIQPHSVASREIAKWFEEETGARVNVLVVPYANVTEKAVLDVTSGAGEYDVMEYWYPMLGSLVDNGVLVDVTDWWDQRADEFEADDFIPVYRDVFTMVDGRRYGIPSDGDLHLLWYNTTIFDEYGLAPPETWAEYEESCQTITEAGASEELYGCAIMGAKVPLILIGTYLNRLGTFGGYFFDADGNPTINSPEAVAALEALISQSEYALPEPAAVAFDEALGGWLTGKVAMVEFWTDLGQMTDNPEQSKIIGEWGVVPLPKGGPDGRHVAVNNAGFGMGVSTIAQDQELALEFLRFNARPDINVRANTIVGGLDPTRWSTLDDPEYREHVTPELADAIKAAHEADVPWPTDPQWAELQEVLNENLSLALTGSKTAEEALNDTQADWEQILGQ